MPFDPQVPAMRDNDDEALFNRRSVAWYWNQYLTTPEDGLDPLVSPLLADDLSALAMAGVLDGARGHVSSYLRDHFGPPRFDT